jgi:arylsulfatase A-like enzyme/glycerophosphoryl diester phosphodiesterase
MKPRTFCLFIIGCLCLAAGVSGAQKKHATLHTFRIRGPRDLRELLSYSATRVPLVSAHRGGARKGFPENCIATFENTLRHTPALLEVDPRYTKDGAIVLMHDATLERTTTGAGKVADHTLAELKALRLKDPEGAVTDYRIPTLDEALEWAKGKTLLALDQKDVPMEARVKKIQEHRAQTGAMVIAYSFDDAQRCFALDQDIMQEVMIPHRAALEKFAQTGVPWRNVVAFVTHTQAAEPDIYQRLHDQGVMCIVGSSRTLDRDFGGGKIPDRQTLTDKYRALIQSGADIIEADLGIEAGEALRAFRKNNRPRSGDSYRTRRDQNASGPPNIIFILADDLGWGELGCFGSDKIKTPNIDRLAAEGMRFTSAYCGTSVCAPSRAALMTGLHMGHNPIRANREIQPEGQMPLPAGTATVAQLLREAGYKTATTGKWGLGFPDSGSEPTDRGFEFNFGYNCQREAHHYYPKHLWRNKERVELDGKTYSHDLIAEETLKWVRAQAGQPQPFFLYIAFTIPHAEYEVPDLGIYADKPWPEGEKRIAAMITRMDASIGQLLDLLKQTGAGGNTLIFFASDNGAMGSNQAHQLEFFNSNGPWRDFKRSMYEGGLRVPALAWWPGKVKPGQVNDTPWAFWDFLPTALDVAGKLAPKSLKTDGLSIKPLLLGKPLPKREYFYWELHERFFQQALRAGDWKVVRPAINKPVELYNLKSDPAEAHDLAARQPAIARRLTALMQSARVGSSDWPIKAPPEKK